MFDHFYFNHGYTELNFGLWPVQAADAYYGPFRVRESAPTPLVMRHDLRPGDAVPRGVGARRASSGTRGC